MQHAQVMSALFAATALHRGSCACARLRTSRWLGWCMETGPAVRGCQAFTLIELLVVVAIIAILAAMLFPVISRAVTKARQVVCITNLKNLGTAIAIYTQDYDERLPRSSPTGPVWYHAVYPYVRTHGIYYCPVRKKVGPGYGMNWLCNGLAIAQVATAGRKILLGDVRPENIGAQLRWPSRGGDPREWWINDPGNDVCRAPDDNSFSTSAGGPYPQRHNGGVCYAYLDGHVKWSPEMLVDGAGCWAPLVRAAGPGHLGGFSAGP